MKFTKDDGTEYYFNLFNLNYCKCFAYKRQDHNWARAKKFMKPKYLCDDSYPDNGVVVRMNFACAQPENKCYTKEKKKILACEVVFFCNEEEYQRFASELTNLFGPPEVDDED